MVDLGPLSPSTIAEIDAYAARQAALELRARVHAAAAIAQATAQPQQYAEPADSDDAKVRTLIAAGGAAVALLAAALREGRISKAQFITRATATLRAQGQTVGELGAARYGTADDFNVASLDRIEAAVAKYADTVTAGTSSAAQLAAWAVGLAGVLHTVSQRGTGDGAQAVGLKTATWDCLDDKNSCDDCIALAEGSPYTADTLPGYPAEGLTPCAGNCRCEVTWSV